MKPEIIKINDEWSYILAENSSGEGFTTAIIRNQGGKKSFMLGGWHRNRLDADKLLRQSIQSYIDYPEINEWQGYEI